MSTIYICGEHLRSATHARKQAVADGIAPRYDYCEVCDQHFAAGSTEREFNRHLGSKKHTDNARDGEGSARTSSHRGRNPKKIVDEEEALVDKLHDKAAWQIFLYHRHCPSREASVYVIISGWDIISMTSTNETI